MKNEKLKIGCLLGLFNFAFLIFNSAAFAADSAHIAVRMQNFGLNPAARRQITLYPVILTTSQSTNIFSIEPRTLTTDTNGVCVFSNTYWGYYRLDLQGSQRSWYLNLGTNQSGLVSAAALVTNTAALPPDPSTNYYTQGQLDAMLGNLTNLNAGVANLGLLTNGILYVSALAADDTGDGSVFRPFQTTTNAQAHATNVTIYVTSGQYQWGNLGRHEVNWYLDPDAVLGSDVIAAGPIFTAGPGTNYTVSGSGQILATTTSVTTTGSGAIRLEGVYVSPAITIWTNITGNYREP